MTVKKKMSDLLNITSTACWKISEATERRKKYFDANKNDIV